MESKDLNKLNVLLLAAGWRGEVNKKQEELRVRVPRQLEIIQFCSPRASLAMPIMTHISVNCFLGRQILCCCCAVSVCTGLTY